MSNKNGGDPYDLDLSLVSYKGTVCIPAKTREKYGITEGTKMYFQDMGNGIIKLGKLSDLLKGVGGNGGNAEQSVPSSDHKTKEVETKHVQNHNI